MPFELARVVAQLVEAVGVLREIKGGEDGVVDLPGCRATDLRAAMEENLEQAYDARLMDFEAGIADGADRDRVGEALEEGKVDMAVEPFGLEAGEAVGDRLEGCAYGAACSAPTSATARKALSCLRKPIPARLSSSWMKLWPLR